MIYDLININIYIYGRVVSSPSGILCDFHGYDDLGWVTTYDMRFLGEWTCICKSCWCEQQGTTVLTFVGVSISNYCAILLCCSDTKLKWLLLHVKHVEEPDGRHFSHKLDHQFCIPCSFWLCALFIPTWGLYCFLKQQHVFSRFSSWRGDCCIENSYWGSFQIHSTRCCRFGRHPILRLWCFDRRRCGHFCAPWAQFMEGPW